MHKQRESLIFRVLPCANATTAAFAAAHRNQLLRVCVRTYICNTFVYVRVCVWVKAYIACMRVFTSAPQFIWIYCRFLHSRARRRVATVRAKSCAAGKLLLHFGTEVSENFIDLIMLLISVGHMRCRQRLPASALPGATLCCGVQSKHWLNISIK